MKNGVGVLLMIFLTMGSGAEVSREKLAEIGPVVEGLIAEGRLVGANVLVRHGGEVVYEGSFGHQDREEGLAMERGSLFRIYSMTKALTSVAALMLCEEGKMSLDDAVARHMPELAEPEVWVTEGTAVEARRSPTVRDLLRHTSGLASVTGGHAVSGFYREGWGPRGGRTLAGLVTAVGKAPLIAEPGTRWYYGASSDVLAAVVARVSGEAFEDFLKKRLIDPLGMVDTSYQVPAEKAGRLATSYRWRDGKLVVAEAAKASRFLKERSFKGGGSGLVSTMTDYGRFLQMIANGGELEGRRYLREDTVDLMRTNQLPRQLAAISFGDDVRHGTGFGMGFSVRYAHDERWDADAALGEYGWGGAASTHYWVSPEHDLVVVTMEQTLPYRRDLEQALKALIYEAVLK